MTAARARCSVASVVSSEVSGSGRGGSMCNTVGALRAGNLTPQSVGLSPTAMLNFIILLIMPLIIAPRFSH